MIVVDASAAVLSLLSDGDARQCLASEDLHIPHLIDSEVAHVLRRHALRGLIGHDDAWRALEIWRRLGARRYASGGLLDRVWALRHNLSAYDATYAALAESLSCPLLTADIRLANAPGVGCPVVSVKS